MGALNDALSQNKLSFSKISEILNILLSQEATKIQNTQVLKEIGFLNEFSYITSDRVANEIIYCTKNNKIIKNVVPAMKLKHNFLEWTKYFFDISDEELDSMPEINKKIDSLKKKPLTIEYFQNNIRKHLFKNKSKKLLEYGIPSNFRYFIWNIIICVKYNKNQYYNYNQELKEYKSILEKQVSSPQIEKDINRTFMTSTEQTTKNLQILRNILNCINKYNPSGYCQGMNFIVGYLLKVTNFDEVRTFYIFKSILYDIKGYFEEGFPLLKKNNNIFNQNFKKFYPKLHQHFQKHEILNEFWFGKWFQTLFTLCLQFDELNIIWDLLLIKGFDFIIYIGLAIIGFMEKDILELKDSTDIISYFDKVLNPQATFPVNKNFFENIDNYIIPLNFVLSKAFEFEGVINISSQRNIDNNIHYTGRKSDSHLLNFKFNNLNDEKEAKKDQKISSKILPIPNANQAQSLSNNNPQKSNFQNIYNFNNSKVSKSREIFSSKILPTYNFNVAPQPNKNGSNMNVNAFNQPNNFNFRSEPIQNNFLNNNNNIGLANRNLNFYP